MLKTTCSRLRAMNLLPMRGRRLLLHGGLTSISCILCIYIYIHIYRFIYIYIYSYIHIFIYSYIHIFIYSYIHTFHIYIFLFMYIYIYTYIIIYIDMFYYIYYFTYTIEWYQIFQNLFSALEPHTGVSLLFMSRDTSAWACSFAFASLPCYPTQSVATSPW